VRVFVAVPLPASLKTKLISLQQEFRLLQLEAAWVREAGFHITLKFLGEIDSRLIEPIVSCMTAVAQLFPPFMLSLTGVGVFPQASSPRVMCVGVQDVTGALRQMQQTLDAQLTQVGFAADARPFTPHLTLARLKRVPRQAEFLVALKAHRETDLGQLEVDHMELIESQLHPSGARYTMINAVHFLRAPETWENR
jgi:RNA 2',3'-cyclic 3'-phosphodiesterase